VSEIELSGTSYALLGMVALRGPTTVYDLKRALDHLAGEFWSVPHVQHYRESERLERLGLLASRQEPDGRRRRVFEITEAGLEAVRRWLGESAPTMALRDEGLLKLFFSELGDERTVAALARDQVAQYERRLNALEEIADRFGPRPDIAPRLSPMQFGEAVYRAAIEFWTAIAERPPQRRSRRGR
jgi:PadR family transcriptional regulator, regulatory protein AphA